MCDTLNQITAEILADLAPLNDARIVLRCLVEGVSYYRTILAQAGKNHVVRVSAPFTVSGGREKNLSGIADISADLGGWVERAVGGYGAPGLDYNWDAWEPLPVVSRHEVDNYGLEGYDACAFYQENGQWKLRFSYDSRSDGGTQADYYRLVYHPLSISTSGNDAPNVGPPPFSYMLKNYGLAYSVSALLRQLALDERSGADALPLTPNLLLALRDTKADAMQRLDEWVRQFKRYAHMPFQQAPRDLKPLINPDWEEMAYC